MKKIKKIIAAAAILTIAASAMGCKMIEKTPEAIQKTVLATVGSEKITKGDFDKEIAPQLKQQFGDDYATNDKVKDQVKQAKTQGLNSLVTQNILIQKATELNLKPSDDEITKQIDETMSGYKTQYPEEGQFEEALKQAGLTEDQLKDSLKKRIIIEAVQQDMVKDITVTDDDVQTYYNENKDTQFAVGAGATASHILVADEETAKNLKAKLDAGADFATLAKENSTDPGSKDKGGSLGFVAYNSTQLVTEFMDGFKNLKEGEVSQPVKSQFGYHLIKATGLKTAEVTPLDQVKDQIKQTLLQQKQTTAFNSKVEEWKTALKVKTYEDQL
ncbi:foldase protein PrsA 1 precursor [Clostridium puniceum]|uniref:Foldase protein PrsA n=1 Tax=Clostridium puniceum TaxID=29367 RepID=A0A1S8TXB4_9CLOT|nr:peptidylprolyl isomerase [Clostridium puniceum]OOM82055.1 foldase protein PrsA 1 precursor [Clostridium puniceum]